MASGINSFPIIHIINTHNIHETAAKIHLPLFSASSFPADAPVKNAKSRSTHADAPDSI